MEFAEKPDVPKEAMFKPLLQQTFWLADRNKYYLRNKSGIYNPLDKADLMDELDLAGLFKDIDEENYRIAMIRRGETLKRFLSEVRNTNRVDAVGKYAGYLNSGLYEVSGLRFLVEYPHRLIEPEQGDMSTFLEFISGQLQSNDQISAALGWIQTAGNPQ